MKFDDDNEKNIFYLGLIILFAWMIVIILCASPQLFRDFIQRHFCCCWTNGKKRQNAESLKEAHERMLSANKSFLTVALPKNPSNILLKQAIGEKNHLIDIPDMIVEVVFQRRNEKSIFARMDSKQQRLFEQLLH